MQRILTKNTPQKTGEKVKIAGWVQTRRDHGKLVFLDVRDRSGVVQVVFKDKKEAEEVRDEWVVEIIGEVAERPENMRNKDIATGTIEIAGESIVVLAKSKPLPFPIDNTGYDIEEEVRLKYRYVDLRRPRLQRNLKVRSEYLKAARAYLDSKEFVEIETPMLTKSTPEGSRDFVVPSRIFPGKFFALPQSPQQYKQLLMTAGFERYYQIARAIRDEDPRADRAFEHSQIDLEMSFVTREDVMGIVEEMTIAAVEAIGGKIAKKPFPVVPYEEAMEKYGTDKPDVRDEKEKKENTLSFVWVVDFPFFEKTKEGAWTFTHNPFSSSINSEQEQWLLNKKNIGKIISSQYDLVCNGLEVAGGSIRANKPEVLEATFGILGYKKEEIAEKFGHMVEAFTYGTPPHGGCAQGFERVLMAYCGEESLREVQAFPQTGQGRTSVMEAPTELENMQLKELHLEIKKGKGKK